ATWADALVTVAQPPDALRAVLDEWGGRGPAYLQVHLSWATTRDEALAIAEEQWASGTVGPPACWDLATPDLIAAAADLSEIEGAVIVSDDLAEHADRLVELRDLGFDALYLHHVGKEQRPFIDAFAEKVLPDVR
ncbi:MAG TPA: hypothetical protein VEA78_12170, partial [Acidimicrobiales bacterium]|nr:hypothetical protein [Acidimicrobiales bacterium]